MPTEVVAKQFARVAGIVQKVNDKPVEKNHIKPIITNSELFLASFVQSPDIFAAQCVLYKSKYSYVENLTFNSMMFCALLCNRNKINDLSCQQMLSCITTLYAERQTTIHATFNDKSSDSKPHINTGLLAVLGAAHMEVWQHCYRIAGFLFNDYSRLTHWPTSFSRLQRIVLLSHYLSVSLTYRKNVKPLSFINGLKKLMQACPEEWAGELDKLLEYPGEVIPGSIVRTISKSPGVVLATSERKLLVSKLNKGTQQSPPLQKMYMANITTSHGAQLVRGFSQIHQWWNEEYEQEKVEFDNPKITTFPLDKPPKALLEVQKHLNADQVDIDKLAEQISSEPAFSEYLKHTATLSNRNKLPIQQVKHGLMMHGYVRANNLLIEQALLLRLNQSYFPLQQDFTQFTRLASQVAFNLAATNNDITPEQASNLVCFACSGLFTQQSLKTRIKWTIDDQHAYRIDQLFTFRQSDNLVKHAITLCQTWQQPTLFIRAIEHHQQMPQDNTQKPMTKILSAILGLSICGARAAFFAPNSDCESTKRYQKEGLALLKISESDYQSAINQSLALCHTHRKVL